MVPVVKILKNTLLHYFADSKNKHVDTRLYAFFLFSAHADTLTCVCIYAFLQFLTDSEDMLLNHVRLHPHTGISWLAAAFKILVRCKIIPFE